MNKFKSAVVLVGLGFFGLVANSAILNSVTEAVSKKLGAASFAEVQFEKGQSTLSAEDLNLVHKQFKRQKSVVKSRR